MEPAEINPCELYVTLSKYDEMENLLQIWQYELQKKSAKCKGETT